MNTMQTVLEAMRPRQWLKNLFIFAALGFSQNLLKPRMLCSTLAAFFTFCLLTSACYILNDLIDLDRDRLHPAKSKRPIASGRLSVSAGIILFLVLLAMSLGHAVKIHPDFAAVACGYCLLQVAYSVALKRVMILDVFAIAAGFVLRVVAGAVLIRVEISSWLYICTTLLAVFLGFCKRRVEIATVAGQPSGMGILPMILHPVRRGATSYGGKSLAGYDLALLDQLISIVAASTLLAYTLYAVSEETVRKFGARNLIFTIPFVFYGIFRYLCLVRQELKGDEPELVLLTDKPLIIDVLLWAAAVAVILY